MIKYISAISCCSLIKLITVYSAACRKISQDALTTQLINTHWSLCQFVSFRWLRTMYFNGSIGLRAFIMLFWVTSWSLLDIWEHNLHVMIKHINSSNQNLLESKISLICIYCTYELFNLCDLCENMWFIKLAANCHLLLQVAAQLLWAKMSDH